MPQALRREDFAPADHRDLHGDILSLVPMLRAFARILTRNPSEADDLLQETLCKALANIHQFSPGTNLKAWLLTIQRNTFYTAYKKKRREMTEADPPENVGYARPDQEWSLKLRAMDRALGRLPADQREALILVGGAGLTYEEAADICGCALGTIKSRVNRGRCRLLELLQVTSPDDFLEGGREEF